MKKVILLLCLFMFSVFSASLFGGDYKEEANLSNISEYEWEIKALDDFYGRQKTRIRIEHGLTKDEELNKATERNNRISERWGTGIAGCIKLGLGYWGLRQNSGYGNTTGVLFSISGIYNIYEAVK